MLSTDLGDQDVKAANRLVTQDILLSNGMSSPNNAQQSTSSMRLRSPLECEDDEGNPSTLLESYSGNQRCHTSSNANALSESGKEEDRRQKLRERKRVQRLNQDFAERERLRARGRIKALRQDPVFRQNERQRDKERRKKARLLNQNQRVSERERDKIHKSLMRSLMGEGTDETNVNSMVNGNGVSNVDTNSWNETDAASSNLTTLSSCHSNS